MDDGNGLVAWLALALAAVTFGWQVYGAWDRRRSRVRISIRHTAAPVSMQGQSLLSMPSLGLDARSGIRLGPDDEPIDYVVVVVVHNDGEGTEYVQDIRVMDQSRRVAGGADNGTGPRELPPRDRVVWPFRPDNAPFDLRRGFFVEVALGSGRGKRTELQSLDDELIALIEAHNERFS